MRIFVTNDDGIDSPLLPFVLDLLSERHEVLCAVPAHDQSWRGKSMSCFQPVPFEERRLGRHLVWVLGGTPADCANIGIHHLCENQLDLLVSGMNIGQNSGIGFMISSGTLGACLEANIAGVPGIALSQALEHDVMRTFRTTRSIEPHILDQMVTQNRWMADIFGAIDADRTLTSEPWTFSVNLPARALNPREIVVSRLSNTLYGSCFVKQDGLFVHDLQDVFIETDEQADSIRLASGMVTITPIDLRTLGQVSYGEDHCRCAQQARRLAAALAIGRT